MNNDLKPMLESIIQEALKPIKEELKTIKTQLDENTQITKSILHRQNETDAKMDSISIDVHKVHGELTFVKEEIADIKDTVDFTYQKTSKNELEIFKLKRE
ncbi:hypothetical protein [Bacillus andreraoultii]|uniref:hypothetical protein n=1 Tax=Bacillus andreraoultii TaxID=1499685 RepID=UPI00067E7046|nr:hypothetical protein [Bacillus andreraoultii]